MTRQPYDPWRPVYAWEWRHTSWEGPRDSRELALMRQAGIDKLLQLGATVAEIVDWYDHFQRRVYGCVRPRSPAECYRHSQLGL